LNKNIIALIISATLIGGIGTTAYASVGPNVTKTTYSTCNQANSNLDKLPGQINKQGLIKYTCQGGFEDVKNNCVKYFQKILSGNKIVESTVNTEEANATENTTDVATTSQDTNNQVNAGQVTENKVDTNTSGDKTTEVTVSTPKTEASKVVTTTPNTETAKPSTTTSKTATPVVQAPTTNVSDSFMAQVEQLKKGQRLVYQL